MIHIIGVSHIQANLNETLSRLRRLALHKGTIVFLEPKKNLLLGIQDYHHPAIAGFFSGILTFCKQMDARIVPLNPATMPSHASSKLLVKYAQQLVEEEYMAEVILRHEAHDALVIIGDVHALRLTSILAGHGRSVHYCKQAFPTPDDVVTHSWRAAAAGASDMKIDLSWLSFMNASLHSALGTPSRRSVQEACWEDEILYLKYVAYALLLTKAYPPYHQEIDAQDHIACVRAQNDCRERLRKATSSQDHPQIAL